MSHKTKERLAALSPGVSLRQLAKRSGIALPHLSRVFSGKRGLTVPIAKRIAEATGATIDRVVNVLAA